MGCACLVHWAYLALILGVLVYTVLVGGQAPVVRAVLMIILYSLARWFFLPIYPMNILGMLWTVFILWNPSSLLDMGMQLTFGITAGLVFLVPRLTPSTIQGRWKTVIAGMVASLVAPHG